jgi:hypothetical protein
MRLALRTKLCYVPLAAMVLSSPGCGGGKAVEGSKPVPSTDLFKHNKAVKSPPPQKPPG